MWSLKFKVINKDSIYTILTNKYKITDYLYPVDYYIKGNKVYILGIHLLEGDEKEKKAFISALKKNPKIKRLEYNNGQLITLIAEEESFYKTLFAQDLYHPAPVFIKKGVEIWNIAAWERDKLEKVLKEVDKWKTKLSEFELLTFKKENLKEVYFPKILPELPQKQKEAFNLAMKRGYYQYPRKTDLQKLAKEMKISTSTLQEHIRKAEAKLIPFFSENLTR